MGKTQNEKFFSRQGLMMIIVLSLLVLITTLFAVVPKWRNQVREILISSQRKIIAKASASLTPDGPHVTVLKIKESGQIHLEVYKADSEGDGQPSLMTRLDLPQGRDGYFVFQGNATNLVLSDMDKDGALDIIAPTFDEQMTARLHVYRYDRVIQSFTRMSEADEPLSKNEPTR